MNSQNCKERLSGFLRRAILQVCDAFEVPNVEIQSLIPPPKSLQEVEQTLQSPLHPSLSLMTFRGEKMGGFLALDCSDEFFASSNILEAGSKSREAMTSWLLELSNQMLGAFKVLLTPYGINMSLNLPEQVSSTDKRLIEGEPSHEAFCVELGTRSSSKVKIIVWLSVYVGKDVDFENEAVPTQEEVRMRDELQGFFL